jgi:2-iminobutanoate/2-iminopropanoate deaminase
MTKARREIETFTIDAVPSELPFSSATRAGDLVHISGQIGHVPGEMRLVEGGMEAEARQALDYLGQSLAAAGSSYDRVLKCTVFFADFKDFKAFNEIYRTFFPTYLPARSGIEVQGLALGARIEIECIALAG